ncbi:ATPase [Streptomyces minutiscleroticus]|uniref:histidine kinase n=1 Tax=Streptomyces minutiscleroticus TaxID=68238 RepID=A0A918NQ29_9ACTN|nr:ATP-binding protein [Streptomyces minutiscleroticus]GGX86642.1 ATPase [Streptomyces minutiscleroticus]
MSHLRAPAARADRREGGRHGRQVARTAAPAETSLRHQLLRLAVLPPVAVALGAGAAVLFLVRSAGVRPGPALWGVLGGAAVVTLAAVVIAAVAARRAVRSVRERVDALRRTSAGGEADLREVVVSLRRGDGPPARRPRARAGAGADPFELLADDLARAHEVAVATVVQAAQLSSQTGSEQKLEVFVNLARRLQSLVHREISILDQLENEIEDPDLLKGLFHIDHLATRIRRHAENLAVLGGAVSRRQWSNPVSMTEVLRSAIAEVEHYSRVKLVPPIAGTLRGHVVADVIHLLAELVENATVFSAPHTQVLLRADLVTSGLAVEVEDRGLGMPVTEQNKMNALLADPDQVNVASLLQDGRIGLFVVSQLARRHGIHVRLQTNIYGGVQAAVIVPQELLGAESHQEQVLGQQRAAVEAGAPAHGGPAHAAPGPVTLVGEAWARDTTGYGDPADGAVPPGGPRGEAAHGARPRSVPVPPAWDGTPGAPGDAARPPAAAPAAPEPVQHGTAEPAVQRGHQHGAADGGPVPLPVRGSGQRRTPADAVPGIHPGDRRAVDENASLLPAPRGGVPRGTKDKPLLPRRRAQEHLAPQLRGGPAPRQDDGVVVGHDPGLVAAFRRGVGLAEAHPAEPAAPPADARPEAARPAPAPSAPVRQGLYEPYGPHGTSAPHEARAAHDTAPAPGDRTSAPRHDGSAPAG